MVSNMHTSKNNTNYSYNFECKLIAFTIIFHFCSPSSLTNSLTPAIIKSTNSFSEYPNLYLFEISKIPPSDSLCSP